MEHQEIYEWLKELAFKNCDKENREQIFWFFEDILEDEIKVEKQEDEIERLNNIIKEVRKYIEPLVKLDNDIMLKGRILKPVLEILDKENNNE